MGRRTKVFINYRRDRAAAEARRIFEALERSLGADRLLMDVVSGAPAASASLSFRRSLGETGVMLALIGEKWLDLAGADGGRGKAAPAALQRAEIASALKAGVPVVPVLLDDAVKPVASALPREIAGLARAEPVRLRGAQFQSDFAGVEGAVTSALNGASPVGAVGSVRGRGRAGAGAGRRGGSASAAARKSPGFLRITAAIVVAAAICGAVYLAAQQ